jgi:ABC-type Na+ transport system ATPase subunit NatA
MFIKLQKKGLKSNYYLGLAESNKKRGQLSKDTDQRVGLADALFIIPILILDEPTTRVLNPNQLLEIQYCNKKGKAQNCFSFYSHIMQEVEDTYVIALLLSIRTNGC